MTVGGLLTGSLTAAVLVAGMRGPESYQLQPVARSELAAASQSLLPAGAAALVAEAESCRAPLAVLTIRGSSTPRGVVRIQSGAYTSPNLQLGAHPARIAVPFPAPYLAGRGRIVIESAAESVEVFLTPGFHVDAGRHATVVDVQWNPKAPC